MYSTQPTHLATPRGIGGLQAILAAVAILMVAALSVAIVMTAANAGQAPVGDHSLDAGESIRGAVFLAADRSLDQIEAQRQVAFSKAHRPGAGTIQTAPSVTADDSTEALRKEHRPIVAAPKLAPAAAADDSTDALRKEHLGIAPTKVADFDLQGTPAPRPVGRPHAHVRHLGRRPLK